MFATTGASSSLKCNLAPLARARSTKSWTAGNVRATSAVNSVPGLQTVRSTTSRGSAEVSLFFEWNENMILQLQLVDAALSRVAQILPPTARITGSKLKELVITDSILPTEAVQKAPNIRTLSIASLIAEAIGRTASEESVSSLFD